MQNFSKNNQEDHIHIISLPCKVTHVSFHQHRENILENSACCVLSQFTEVLHSNPDCETQCSDLPYGTKYPSYGIQKCGISRIANRALKGAEEK
jgi:hypothetical protein